MAAASSAAFRTLRNTSTAPVKPTRNGSVQLRAPTLQLRQDASCIARVQARSGDVSGAKQQGAHAMASKEVARAGLVALMRALAATKLYPASALRVVAASVQAIAPVVDLTRSRPRSPGSDSDDASPSPPIPYPIAPEPHPAPFVTPIVPMPQAAATVAPPPASITPSTFIPHAPLTFASLSTTITPPQTTLPILPASPTALPSPPQQQQQRLVLVPDLSLAAALWTDELRHLQTRCQHLADEVSELTARRRQQHARSIAPASTDNTNTAGEATASYDGSAPDGSFADGLFVDDGPEFCTLTCQVETCAEVKQAREAIKQQIVAMAQRSVWVAGATPAAAEVGCDGGFNAGHVKELQRQWEAANVNITHLMVRLVVLEQLPAQPKQRPTVRHVKAQVLEHLTDRLNKLVASHQPTPLAATAAAVLHAAPPSAAPVATATPLLSAPSITAPFIVPGPSPWQPDPPPAHGTPDKYTS